MDLLPWEIMNIICSAASIEKRSLRALSQVNQSWSKVAVQYLYRQLEIRPTAAEQLSETVDRVLEHPMRRQYLQHLRRLDIVARDDRPSDAPRKVRKVASCYRGINPLDPFLENDGSARFGEVTSCHVLDWSPLARLISLVNQLEELHYAVCNTFPAVLLDALHKNHPTCRLTLLYFNLELSIRSWGTEPNKARLALVTSPCLHAVRIVYYERLSNVDDYEDIQDQAVLRTVSMAPCLEEVSLLLLRHNSPRFSHPSQWPAFELGGEVVPRLGRLSMLSFSANMKMTERRFNEWYRFTDLSYLRSWDVGCLYESRLPRAMAVGLSLPRLERLSMCLQPRPDVVDHDYWPAVETMLQSLPQLKYLWLVGCRDAPFLETVLARHGATLQGLRIAPQTTYCFHDPGPRGPFFTAEEIFGFAKQCPAVRQLHIKVQRIQGQPPETRIYEAIGQFPALLGIKIDLECVPPSQDWDQVEGEEIYQASPGSPAVPIWYVRHSLINAAVDEMLAQEVFDTIFSSQYTRRLETLKLCPFFDEWPRRRVNTGSVMRLLAQLLRHWLVTRTGPNHPRGRSVVENKRWKRERKMRGYRPESELPPLIQHIVHPIWPQSVQEGWSCKWPSYPLQGRSMELPYMSTI